MPISVALPAPSLRFYSDFQYPIAFLNQQIFTAITENNTFTKTRDAMVEGTSSVAPLLAQGGAGVTQLTGQVGGRIGSTLTTVAVAAGAGFNPDTWLPAYDAAVFNAGALLDPSSVVAIIDYHAALGQAAFAGVDDITGFWFVPDFATTGFPTKTLGGGGASGGFGVSLVDDGAGGNQWDFVSYDAVPATLLRVADIGAIPDVTRWSTFRFTIIGAGPGRAATLTLAVNGTAVAGVQGLAFDDVTLMRPNTLVAACSGYMFGRSVDGLAGGTLTSQIYARFGRFTTAGEEVQGV